MTGKKHELLADRLAEILTRLSQGATLSVTELAEEFKTHPRTIERDLKERFRSLPISEENGRYSLVKSYLGKLDFDDIKIFAALAGVSELFPALDREAIRRLLDSHATSTYASKGYFFEDASVLKPMLILLETAIKARNCISFTYKDNIRKVEPYKLVHHHNCWYLAAVHENTLKTYRIRRIESIQIHTDAPSFHFDSKINKLVEDEENIWFGADKEQVILKVDPQIASHFSFRKLLPEQDIIQPLDNGGLLISSKMTNSLQILPIVRYWLPHIHIVSPESLRIELEDELRTYLVS